MTISNKNTPFNTENRRKNHGVPIMKSISGGVNAPIGFFSTGKNVGVKKRKADLGIIYSETPLKVAAVFTTNKLKAAPILWNHKIVTASKPIHAIVINSGNANACTGSLGNSHTQMMADSIAQALQIQSDEVIVTSTGVIGVPLPIEKICKGIVESVPLLGNSEKDAFLAASAIMTTDKMVKQIAVEFEIDGKVVRIGGMAKGSGMIHPNMATMLSFITTDASISQNLLQELLSEVVENTYNMISVDGDTSTNDQVTAVANGLAGNAEISTVEDQNYVIFKDAFHYVNAFLAKLIVLDGEGANKLIKVNITGAFTEMDAKLISKSVISSNLVKTAFFGEDANWGRIIAAMGYSKGNFTPEKVSIEYASNNLTIELYSEGNPITFNEDIAARILQNQEIDVNITLGDGNANATALGCDLSEEYVKINGGYRS